MTKRKNSAEVEPAAPAPTTELRREGRVTRIAKALASGATVTDIAEAEGIGRTLASRTANSPECRQLIADFVNAEHVEMRGAERVLDRAHGWIEVLRAFTLVKPDPILPPGARFNYNSGPPISSTRAQP